MMEKVKVALIGFGGIARFHNAAYKKLMERGVNVELVAVCDKNAEQFTKTVNINIGGGDSALPEGIHIYTDMDDMIAREDFDMVDICLPTFLHKDFVIKALNAGKHVFCEKPMALCSADGEQMYNLATEKNLRLMFGLELHFSPRYRLLGDLIKSNELGRLENLFMWRHSEYPYWGAGDHFSNVKKSGGLTIDMHVHDIDLVRHFVGMPNSVDCVMYDNLPYVQLASSELTFDDMIVKVEASWDSTHDFKFMSGYDAKFEKGAVVLRDDAVTVYEYGKEPYAPDIVEPDLFEEEIEYFVSLVSDSSKKNEINPPKCTLQSTKLIESLRESAKQKKVRNTMC